MITEAASGKIYRELKYTGRNKRKKLKNQRYGSATTKKLRTSIKALDFYPFKGLTTKYHDVNKNMVIFEGKTMVIARYAKINM